MQQFWICVISTLHFILCRKSVEITVFFAASASAYYRQLPICSLRLQRLKMFCVILSGHFSNRCSSSYFHFCWFKISPMGLLNGPPISQASFLRCQANFICRYDGIGRHSRLKICLEQSSTGSSPVSGTILCEQKRCHEQNRRFSAVLFYFLRKLACFCGEKLDN